MFNYLLKSSEIAIKGKIRSFFESILKENISKKLKENLVYLKNLGGGFLVKTKTDALEDLKKILGIAKIIKVEIFSDLTKVEEYLKNFPYEFKLKVKRADKTFPLTSKEIYEKLSIALKEKIKKEGRELILEYRDKNFYLGESYEGFGGLPVGSSGKGLVLISTGFDSPVASFLMMKRGLKLTFLHFHSYPQTSMENIEKIKKLIKILNEYNLYSILYLINILEIQKFYLQKVPAKYLVIFYRRTMFRLATKLAKELKIKALITGENLGQVASQTIDNIKVIENATDLLVLRPLIGFNKQEIINLAEKIGTKKISELPGEDCCSLFIPRHPETKANLDEILKIEKQISSELSTLEEIAYKNKELEVFN